MDNFEEKYSEYIKELKNELPFILKNKRLDNLHDFNYNFQGNGFKSVLYVIWFLCGTIGGVFVSCEKIVLGIVAFVIWIGVGIWLWLSVSRFTDDIADYFFLKYKYRQIIEDRIEQDKKQEIEVVLNEMFKKDNLDFVDLDMYKFKIDDIKYFYNRCLDKIKYENFEE